MQRAFRRVAPAAQAPLDRVTGATRADEHRSPESQWFWDHYEMAAGEIVEAFASAGIDLAGATVADVGCGDGIMALGLCHRARPASLVGFDINATDPAGLAARAAAEGVSVQLPPELDFRASEATRIPSEDAQFDVVYSWSAFEHIFDPIGVLTEIRRILRPGGAFFLQLWPFYLSARGSHLWEWFPEEFHHLRENHKDVVQQLAGSDRHSSEWTGYMSNEFERLNRVTLEELQRSVLASGFDVRRLELLTAPTGVTPELGRYTWADLAVSGVKLIASPRG